MVVKTRNLVTDMNNAIVEVGGEVCLSTVRGTNYSDLYPFVVATVSVTFDEVVNVDNVFYFKASNVTVATRTITLVDSNNWTIA